MQQRGVHEWCRGVKTIGWQQKPLAPQTPTRIAYHMHPSSHLLGLRINRQVAQLAQQRVLRAAQAAATVDVSACGGRVTRVGEW